MTALEAFSAQSRVFCNDECTKAMTGQQLQLGTGQWVEQRVITNDGSGERSWSYGYLDYAEAVNQLNDL